jgi:rubrerythrin
MKNVTTVDGILDFAITGEEESYQFYTDLARRVERPGMRDIFSSFAKEEMSHKQKLLGVKAGHRLAPTAARIADLKISDYLVDVAPSPQLDYQGALMLAMKKEKAAFMLYTQLADIADHEDLKSTLVSLAQEEARHKLRFEMEYDQFILTEM